MSVKHYMIRPSYINPKATIKEVAAMMCDKDVDAVIVGTPEEPLGIFSDRDFLRTIIKDGKPKETTLVRDVMSSPLVTVHPDTSVEKAHNLMHERNFRRLPVRRAGKIIGLVLDSNLHCATGYNYASKYVMRNVLSPPARL